MDPEVVGPGEFSYIKEDRKHGMIEFGNRLSGRVAFAPHTSPSLPSSGRPFSSILWSFQAIQEPFGLLYASITSPRKGRARER
jgi:hypothetical protein